MEVCRKCIEEIEQVSKKVISREETLLMPVGHGNRNVEFNSLVENNLGIRGDQLGFYKTFTLFASSSQHSFEDMEEKFTSQGFRRVILLPFFLLIGFWVKRIYTCAKIFQKKHIQIEFLKASCLNHHNLMAEALIERVKESISQKQP